MPMRGELPPVTSRSVARSSAAERAASRIGAVLSDGDLQAVAMFCAIALLATFNAILRFPEFGLQVATRVVFP